MRCLADYSPVATKSASLVSSKGKLVIMMRTEPNGVVASVSAAGAERGVTLVPASMAIAHWSIGGTWTTANVPSATTLTNQLPAKEEGASSCAPFPSLAPSVPYAPPLLALPDLVSSPSPWSPSSRSIWSPHIPASQHRALSPSISAWQYE